MTPIPTRHRLLIAGLALVRVIGWGSIYYAPSVLVAPLARDLGFGPATVFAGITILLALGAFVAPALGRMADRSGTRRMMIAGTLICAAGLSALAGAQGPVSYLASWVVLGLGHAMTLSAVGNVTIAQLVGQRTRRVLGIMMLVTGLASSVFWPLAAWLTDWLGWRGCWLVFAAMQIVIVLPIHCAIPRGQAPEPAPSESAADRELDGRLPAQERQVAFWLVASAFSASGLVSWGLPLHLIAIMQANGVPLTEAVAIATLSGPATLAARLIETAFGERIAIERVTLLGLLFGPLACLGWMLAPGSAWAGIAFVVVFSGAMGVISIARATLPLSLFGRRGYGTMLGRLSVPQNLAFAAAPLLFAALIERLGSAASLAIAAVIQAMALMAMASLARRLSSP